MRLPSCVAPVLGSHRYLPAARAVAAPLRLASYRVDRWPAAVSLNESTCTEVVPANPILPSAIMRQLPGPRLTVLPRRGLSVLPHPARRAALSECRVGWTLSRCLSRRRESTPLGPGLAETGYAPECLWTWPGYTPRWLSSSHVSALVVAQAAG